MTEIVKANLENGVQKIRITADKGYHPARIQLWYEDAKGKLYRS